MMAQGFEKMSASVPEILPHQGVAVQVLLLDESCHLWKFKAPDGGMGGFSG